MGSFADPAFRRETPEEKGGGEPVVAIPPDLGLHCFYCHKERDPRELGVINRSNRWDNRKEETLGCKSCFPALDTKLTVSSLRELIRVGGKSLRDEVIIAAS